MAADRPSPNRTRLLATARRLGPLGREVVFVGGQITELLITDPAAARIRPTVDVDVVVPVASHAAWRDLEQRLGALGFHPDRRAGAPICRFRTDDELVLDAMPLDERVLGFTNAWYTLAVTTSEPHVLDVDLTIRRPTAPAFLATKWAAHQQRGADDPRLSHDLEDIIALTSGRASLPAECAMLPVEAREFVGHAARTFLDDPDCIEVILANLPDAQQFPGLAERVVERFRRMAEGR